MALCQMRESGAGATSAQHMIEAPHFLDASVKFLLVDLRAVVSGRCKGVAKNMYLTKNPLDQKHPLLLAHVRHLEELFQTLPNTMKCILGQLLFSVRACCRWKDAQRVIGKWAWRSFDPCRSVTIEDSYNSRGQNAFPALHCFGDWCDRARLGIRVDCCRQAENFCFDDFRLPSFSERVCMWTSSPMSASEATF